jgi:hypothetical protein
MSGLKHVAGLAWFRLADYEAARAIMADGHVLPKTYTEWRIKAEQNEKKAQRQGFITVRAYIEPDQFPAWCGARGLDVDAKARQLFAMTVADETDNSLN